VVFPESRVDDSEKVIVIPGPLIVRTVNMHQGAGPKALRTRATEQGSA
jgi:hypothetical protein